MMKPSMNEIESADAVDGPVVIEDGRSPSALSTGQGVPPAQGALKPGPLAHGQRWSAGRKREVVLRLIRGEAAEMLSRDALPRAWPADVQARAVASEGRGRARRRAQGAREADPADGQLAAAMQRSGELSMEVELLRARLGAVRHRRQVWGSPWHRALSNWHVRRRRGRSR